MSKKVTNQTQEILDLYRSGMTNKTEIARRVFDSNSEVNRGTVRRAITRYEKNRAIYDEC
jgi:DNA-binding NarL/FixJ family response regulator